MNRYEAKTLEEAIQLACNEKKVEKQNLVYFVVEENQGGLFGIGAKTIIEAFCQKDVETFINDYLGKYFENLGVKCDIYHDFKDNCNHVRLDCENNAVIIGKAGKTLQSINTVVKAAASAEFKRRINVLIDVNNYKEERYEKLKEMVAKIAKTVQKTKVSARLGQMSNDERKIIHQYLSTFPHVRTESEGEGSDRRLKIIYDEKN